MQRSFVGSQTTIGSLGLGARVRRLLCATALATGVAVPCLAQSATGVYQDQGGAVFNVKAYGARGNGSTADSAAIQKALDAAVAAGGGIVYFPAGTYPIDVTLNHTRSDVVSLVGSGVGSVLRIRDQAVPGVLVKIPVGRKEKMFHSGRISSLRVECERARDGSRAGIAISMDSQVIAPELSDLNVFDCHVAFELVNQDWWTERLVARRITDDLNNHLFHFNNKNDIFNSYGYGVYDGIFLNKEPGQDAFYLTGGAYLYHSSFVIKGNFTPNAPGASIFNVQGSPGGACPGAAHNRYDIAVEGGELGGRYAVVTTANNGCTGGATGNAMVHGIGTVNASGAIPNTTSLITSHSNAAFFAGKLITTAAAFDTVSGLTVVAPGQHCFVQPGNAAAAGMSNGTHVSSVNWGSVTVMHPPVPGGEFQIWCQ